MDDGLAEKLFHAFWDPIVARGYPLACNQLGRNFIGWELNPEYHAIATRRLNGDEAKPNPAQPSLFGGAA